MRFDVRLTALRDADLIALIETDYNVRAMMEQAIVNYAHATPFKILLDVPLVCPENSPKVRLFSFVISDSDKDVRRLISSISKGKRSQFFKNCLRNAFSIQNLSVYLSDSAIDFQQRNIEIAGGCLERNVYPAPISVYKKTGCSSRRRTSKKTIS